MRVINNDFEFKGGLTSPLRFSLLRFFLGYLWAATQVGVVFYVLYCFASHNLVM